MATSTDCVTIEETTQKFQNLRLSSGDCVSRNINGREILQDEEYRGKDIHVSETSPQSKNNNNDKGSCETQFCKTKSSSKRNKNLQPGRAKSYSQLSQQCNASKILHTSASSQCFSHQQSVVETDGETNMTNSTNSTKDESSTCTTQVFKLEEKTSHLRVCLAADPNKSSEKEHSSPGVSRTNSQTEQCLSLSENARTYLDSPMTAPGTSQQPVTYVEKQERHSEPAVQITKHLGSCTNAVKNNTLIETSSGQSTVTVETLSMHSQATARPVHGEIEADAVLSRSSNGSFEDSPVDSSPEGQPCISNNLSTLHQSSSQASNFSTQEMTSSSNSEMQDFILLHTDQDEDEVIKFEEDIRTICAVDTEISPPLSVDRYTNIDAGQTPMSSLQTLHERYRNILVYTTKNLELDEYQKFLTEIIITFGLKEGKGKEHRVIPVFALQKSSCKIYYLTYGPSGFKYHDNYKQCAHERLRRDFEKYVRKTVINARNKMR